MAAANIVNGKSTVRFDGFNDVLVAGSGVLSALSNAVTVFTVHRTNVIQNSLVLLAVSDDATNRFALSLPWSDGNAYFDFGNIGAGGRVSGSWGLSTSAFNVGGFVAGGSAMTIYKNGTSIGTVATSGTFNPATKTLNIGTAMSADLAELIIYNVALSATNRANIEKYLGTKYGLTVAGGSAVDPSTVTGLQGWWKTDYGLQTLPQGDFIDPYRLSGTTDAPAPDTVVRGDVVAPNELVSGDDGFTVSIS